KGRESGRKGPQVVPPWTGGLAALLGGRAAPPSGAAATTAPLATPTAAVDAATQAYLTLLHSYYDPWVQDHITQRTQCGPRFNGLPATTQQQQLPDCRPILVAELAAGKTLIAQLATAHPPARWQAAHDDLKHAMQGVDAWDGQRLQAIDAGDVSRFVNLTDGVPQVLAPFCGPIRTINAGPPFSLFAIPDFSCS